jgi:capsular polysaccharide transport system permease protein
MGEHFAATGFPESYFSLLRRAILRLPSSTLTARRELYEQIEKIQKDTLLNRDPRPEQTEIEAESRLLRYAIRVLEDEIRGGADIADQGHRLPSLDDMRERIFASREARLVRKRPVAAGVPDPIEQQADTPTAPESDGTVSHLSRALKLVAKTSRQSPPGDLAAIWAVTIHQLQMVASEGRLALLWLLVQPAILVAIIMAMYFLLATNFILNMDVPTFALLGSTTWIMFRYTMVRVSASFLSGRALINFPGVTSLHAALGQGLVYLLIFSFVFVVLLTLGHLVELTTLPYNVSGVALALIGMWLIALFLGVLLGALAVVWPFSRRFISVIVRALQLFSSVFFVSEQLPEEYRHYVLWSPTAHGMQILRDQYFSGYHSTDASLLYFVSGLVTIGAAALLCHAAVRSDIHPL